MLDATGNTPYDKEYRLLKKNGEYAHFRAYGGSFRDERGNVIRIAGALMDITETKNTLINNELQLAKLNLMIQATKIGLWDMEVVKDDPVNPGNIFIWSDEFRNMLGFSNEVDFPNVFSSWINRLHPEDKERALDSFEKHLLDTTGTTPFDIEYRLLKKNGGYGYFRASGETIRDENGHAIRTAGALIDITETKRMTEALNEAIDELERNQGMLYALNNAAALLLNSDMESFESALFQSMKTIGEAVKVDRMHIWKNYTAEGQLHCSQIYEWSERVEPQQGKEFTVDISYSGRIPGWESSLSNGECINNLVRNMSPEEQELLSSQGIVSVIVVPVFIKDRFWGFAGFDDCHNERVFTKEEESILRSGGVLFANAWLRNEMVESLRDTSAQL